MARTIEHREHREMGLEMEERLDTETERQRSDIEKRRGHRQKPIISLIPLFRKHPTDLLPVFLCACKCDSPQRKLFTAEIKV